MNLFDLFATLSLDSSEYEKGLDGAERSASTLGSKIGGAVSTIAKVSAAALGVAATGVTAITKSAVGSYSNYQQLVGGVETLFGDFASVVLEDADQAFKTAGMSANQYMETTIQSAAAMINSLDGDQAKAAELMSMSITDMADNVNKMGTTMEAVQNAYRGFSRGNFTMLDNLALGFAGTKEGMQQLLDKAHEISGIEYDISSYSDMVEAIHVVQTEMGITGTTSKEAADTISGSAASVGAAWKNLVTNLAVEGADMEGLINALMSAIETTLNNIIPTIERVLKNLGSTVQKFAPTLVNAFVGLLSSSLPNIVKIAQGLLTALSQALVSNADLLIQTGFDIMLMLMDSILQGGNDLSGMVGSLIESIGTWIYEYSSVIVDDIVGIILLIAQTIVDNVPVFAENIALVITELAEVLTNPDNAAALLMAALTIIQTIAQSMLDNVGTLIDSVLVVIDNIIAFIVENLPAFMDTAVQIIMALVDGFIKALPSLLDYLPKIIDSIVTTLLTMIDKIVETGVTLLTALLQRLPYILSVIAAKMPEIITSIVNALTDLIPTIISTGVVLLTALVENMPEILRTIADHLPDIITSIVDGLTDMLPTIVQAGVDLFVALIHNLPEIITEIVNALPEIISAIVSGIIGAIPELWQAGKDLIQGLWNGINNAKEWLREKISGFFGGVVDSIKAFFGIKSPSKLFADIGEMLDRGLAKGVEDYADLAVSAAEDMANEVYGVTDRDYDFTASADADEAPAWRKNAPVINVYGAEGQDVNELADVISERLAFTYNQEQAVWA